MEGTIMSRSERMAAMIKAQRAGTIPNTGANPDYLTQAEYVAEFKELYKKADEAAEPSTWEKVKAGAKAWRKESGTWSRITH
jgi:hypothetical protein